MGGRTKIVTATGLALLFGILSGHFLELIITSCKKSSNVITLAQFLFIPLQQLFYTPKDIINRKIPITSYLKIVAIFSVVSVANNYAFSLNVPMTLHTVIRAGNLLASLIMGKIFLKRSYSKKKYLSVFLISVGIFITFNETNRLKNVQQTSGAYSDAFDYQTIAGLFLLLFTLFLTSYLGILQEKLYASYGKHTNECLFYTHFLSIPLFFFLTKDINQQVSSCFMRDWTMFALLLGNVFFQCLCAKCIYFLTTECNSLTITLILTLRKFITLIWSIYYFKHQFTAYHWAGASLVFLSTFLFMELKTKSD